MTDAPRPREIRFRNLARWLYQTVNESRWAYHGPARSVFDRARFAALLAPNLDRPIFVVGAPRSGTTFLGNCLASLPEITYHYEPVLTKAAGRYVHEGRWDWKRASRFYRRVYRFLMRLRLDADLRFAEKTPSNSHLVAFLPDAFPDSQFLHIVRDGRDAALSLSKKPWMQRTSGALLTYEPRGLPNGTMADVLG